MTSHGFKIWREIMKLSQAEAAEALGVSKPTIENYERGIRRDTGHTVVIPEYIALACAALYHRVEAWDDADKRAGVFA